MNEAADSTRLADRRGVGFYSLAGGFAPKLGQFSVTGPDPRFATAYTWGLDLTDWERSPRTAHPFSPEMGQPHQFAPTGQTAEAIARSRGEAPKVEAEQHRQGALGRSGPTVMTLRGISYI